MIDVVKSAFGKIGKKFNKEHDFYLSFYIMLNVIWVFMGMFLYVYSKHFYYVNLSTSYVLLFILNSFYICFLFFSKKIRFDKIDVFLILLFVFGLISVIFAHDSSTALYGFRNRYEGFFQLLYYYSLMFLSTTIYNDKYKKRIIFTILLFGLINAFICFLQIFNVLKFISIPNRGSVLGQGFVMNSNFFGSYMVLCLGLSVGLFLYNKSGKLMNIFYLFLCIAFYSGLLMSSALSGMIGFFFIIFCLIIYSLYLLKKKCFSKVFSLRYILLILCLVTVNILLNNSGKTLMNKDVSRFVGETSEITKGNMNDSFGSARMFIYKNTVKIIPKYIFHGIGIDNFYYAFGNEPLFTSDGKLIVFFDKAHCEYLQKSICEGLFSCLTYVGMLFIIFINSSKRIFEKKNYIVISLFLGFAGYCVQAAFNISVIEVAPLFWIVCGLLYERNKKSVN